MTLDSFIAKYEGKTKGYPTDNQYQGECLSLVKLYIQECFGIAPPPSGSNSAYGYWSNFPDPLGTVFQRIKKTSENFPKRGDIPIWDTSVGGGYGHIDIVIDADRSSFTGFDQNWNGRWAHRQSHSYNNVVGWLTPKEGNTMVQVPDDVYSKLVTNSDAYDAVCDALKVARNSSKDVSTAEIHRLQQAASQPTPAPTEPPVIAGWKNNGLQVRVGDRTYNYEKS